MCGTSTPKQRCIAMVCDSKSHTVILWDVIKVKLNIVKKTTGLKINDTESQNI